MRACFATFTLLIHVDWGSVPSVRTTDAISAKFDRFLSVQLESCNSPEILEFGIPETLNAGMREGESVSDALLTHVVTQVLRHTLECGWLSPLFQSDGFKRRGGVVNEIASLLRTPASVADYYRVHSELLEFARGPYFQTADFDAVTNREICAVRLMNVAVCYWQKLIGDKDTVGRFQALAKLEEEKALKCREKSLKFKEGILKKGILESKHDKELDLSSSIGGAHETDHAWTLGSGLYTPYLPVPVTPNDVPEILLAELRGMTRDLLSLVNVNDVQSDVNDFQSVMPLVDAEETSALSSSVVEETSAASSSSLAGKGPSLSAASGGLVMNQFNCAHFSEEYLSLVLASRRLTVNSQSRDLSCKSSKAELSSSKSELGAKSSSDRRIGSSTMEGQCEDDEDSEFSYEDYGEIDPSYCFDEVVDLLEGPNPSVRVSAVASAEKSGMQAGETGDTAHSARDTAHSALTRRMSSRLSVLTAEDVLEKREAVKSLIAFFGNLHVAFRLSLSFHVPKVLLFDIWLEERKGLGHSVKTGKAAPKKNAASDPNSSDDVRPDSSDDVRPSSTWTAVDSPVRNRRISVKHSNLNWSQASSGGPAVKSATENSVSGEGSAGFLDLFYYSSDPDLWDEYYEYAFSLRQANFLEQRSASRSEGSVAGLSGLPGRSSITRQNLAVGLQTMDYDWDFPIHAVCSELLEMFHQSKSAPGMSAPKPGKSSSQPGKSSSQPGKSKAQQDKVKAVSSDQGQVESLSGKKVPPSNIESVLGNLPALMIGHEGHSVHGSVSFPHLFPHQGSFCLWQSVVTENAHFREMLAHSEPHREAYSLINKAVESGDFTKIRNLAFYSASSPSAWSASTDKLKELDIALAMRDLVGLLVLSARTSNIQQVAALIVHMGCVSNLQLLYLKYHVPRVYRYPFMRVAVRELFADGMMGHGLSLASIEAAVTDYEKYISKRNRFNDVTSIARKIHDAVMSDDITTATTYLMLSLVLPK